MTSRYGKKRPKYTPPKECHKSPVGPALFSVPDDILFAHQLPTICLFVAKFRWEYPPLDDLHFTCAGFMPRVQTNPAAYQGSSAKNTQGPVDVQSGWGVLAPGENNNSWSGSGGLTMFLNPGVQQFAWQFITTQWNITKGKPLYCHITEQTLGTDQATVESLIIYI